MTEGRRFSRLGIVLMVVFGVLSGAAVLYLATPDLPSKKQVLAGFFCLAGGAFVRDRKNYFLLLWVFIQTFGVIGFKVFFPLTSGVEPYAVDPADLLLAGLFAAWLIEAATDRRTPAPLPKDCLLALSGLCLVSLLSVINAPDRTYALYQTSTLLRGTMIFLYIGWHARDSRTLWGIVWVLIVAMAFQSILSITQEFNGGNLEFKQFTIHGIPPTQALGELGTFIRVSGTYPSGNMFSLMFLDFLLPLVVAVLLINDRNAWLMAILTAIYILGLFTLVYTFSRAGWAMACVGAVVFGIGLLRKSKTIVGKWIPAAGLLLVIICTRDLLISRSVSDHGRASQVRMMLVPVALQMIKSHPWSGVGTGRYVQVMHYYDATDEHVTHLYVYPVHNFFLFFAAENGLPALGFLTAFILLICRRAWRAINLEAPVRRLLALGLSCGLLMSLGHSMYEFIPAGNYFMFWLVCGLLVAIENAPRSENMWKQVGVGG